MVNTHEINLICAPTPLLKDTDVDNSKTVSLRHAVSVESSSGGQGYVKYNCIIPKGVGLRGASAIKIKSNVPVAVIAACCVSTSNFSIISL